jgi:hypothetical protein
MRIGCARLSVHRSACVAGNDVPLIGERAATRGRSATEGGDEHAGMRRTLSLRASAPGDWIGTTGTSTCWRVPERFETPARPNDATRDAHGPRRPQRPSGLNTFASAFVAGHDAPRIGERAATRQAPFFRSRFSRPVFMREPRHSPSAVGRGVCLARLQPSHAGVVIAPSCVRRRGGHGRPRKTNSWSS